MALDAGGYRPTSGNLVTFLSTLLPSDNRTFDCSATSTWGTGGPLDGEFINCNGPAGSAATQTINGAVRMVWGNKSLSERQATQNAHVPVLWHMPTNLHIKTYLWAYDTGGSATASSFVVGKHLSVQSYTASGDRARLVLVPAKAATAQWVVGHILAVPGSATPADLANYQLECEIYPQPMYITTPS